MTLLDSTQPTPDTSVAPPSGDEMFPDRPGETEMFPDRPGEGVPDRNDEPQRRAAGILGPLKGAVAPGPVGDWIFGNTQHSSLARIMAAFGNTVGEDVGESGKNLGMSEDTAKWLKDKGVFNDYVKGQSSLLRMWNETFLRAGAVGVNTAIYGVPAVWHGLQDAVMEAGEQAEGTEAGKAIGAKGLAREIAAVPEAFPTFEFRMGMPHAPVPEPLAAARDLNVIGPGGEAAWKGVAPAEATGEAVPAAEAAATETPAAAPDIHAAARAADPKTFEEFDALEKRRDLLRKWIDDPQTTVPPSVPNELKATEARLRELDPVVTAAYDSVREGFTGEANSVNVEPNVTRETFVPAVQPSAGAGQTQILQSVPRRLYESVEAFASSPAGAEIKGQLPELRRRLFEAGENPEAAVRGLWGAELADAPPGLQQAIARGMAVSELPHAEAPEGRAVEDQRAYIVQDVKRQAIAAGRPEAEAEANAELVADQYITLSQRLKGAFGTGEEMYDREAAFIRAEKIKQKQTLPGAVAARNNFTVEAMEQGKARALKFRNEGGPAGNKVYKTTEQRYGHMSKEDLKAAQDAYEDSIEALEPEERAGAREQFTPEDANELFQIAAYHGSPHHFERFDVSKIGTGEGAQAYGHGLYFAENENVAQGYKASLSVGDLKSPNDVAAVYLKSMSSRQAAVEALRENAAKHEPGNESSPEVLRKAADLLESGATPKPPGALYKVSLKPDKEDLLDWDKPLSEQSEKVKAAVDKSYGLPSAEAQKTMSGEDLYRAIRTAQGPDAASKLLHEAGIPGIKYADAGSRYNPSLLPKNPIADEARRFLDAADGDAAKALEAFRASNPVERWGQTEREEVRKVIESAGRKLTHNFVIFHDKDVEITHRNGEALTKEERADAVRELEQRRGDQETLGRYNPPTAEARGLIRLVRAKANASTLPHELGHDFLELYSRYANHPAAPDGLKADWSYMKDRYGLTDDNRPTQGHERFANDYLQWLREGVAPSQRLKRVFTMFRDWLMKLGDTYEKFFKKTKPGNVIPLSDEMRQVFRRMHAINPDDTIIAPEREAGPEFHEKHEALAESTAPAFADEVGDEVQSEIDFHATQDMINSYDDRFSGIEQETRDRPHGTAQPAGHGDAAGPGSGTAGNAAQAGGEHAGAGEAAAQGAGALPKPAPAVKTEPPPSANTPFAPVTKYVDKIGNFRIDGLNDPNQIFDALREFAEKRGGLVEQHRRGIPARDGDLLNLGLASGLKPDWLDSKKIGDAYNHREMQDLGQLFIAASAAVRDASALAETGDPAGILAKAEAMARLEMLQAHLSGAEAEAGRTLGVVRRMVKRAWGGAPPRTAAEAAASLERVRQLSAQKWESPEALSAALKAETGRTLFQIQEMAGYVQKLQTPGQIARMVFDTSNGKMKQRAVFYYVNALLSGPITHLRYAVGNQLTALYSPVRTTIATGIDFGAYHAGLQDERRIFLGEAGAELYALGRGTREGIAAGKEGWKLGTTPDLPGEGAPELFGAQPVINPIPGKLGYVIGLPGKNVAMVHGFAGAVRYRQEINRLAYRTAMREGLTGDDFTARVADLTDRPTPENMESARQVARSDLYMAKTDYNSFTANLSRISDSNILAKVILPFVKIGMQVESKAIENSPLAPFQKQARANLSGANGIEARNTQIASMVGGTGLMALTASMVANGDVTGHGPHDKKKREIWLKTHKPYQVSIGPLTLTYNGWGYLGKLMAISANAYETHQGWGDDDGHSIASAYYQGFQEALLDDSFLRGVKDFLDAKEDPDRYGARFTANMLLNWMPMSIGMGQTARMIDPYQRETHTSADGVLDTIFKEAWNKVPGASFGLHPKRDVFGEPIPTGGMLGGLSGLPVADYTNDQTVKMLDSLHIGISDVRDSIRGVKLTDQQFDDYSRIAGRALKQQLDNFMQTTGRHLVASGTAQDRAKLVELIGTIVNVNRKYAQDTIMKHAYGSDNDIQAKATQAKKIKKGLVAPDTVH